MWEAVLLDDEVVELIAQEFGTAVAAMTVIDAEKAALGPRFIFSVRWFRDVQNY